MSNQLEWIFGDRGERFCQRLFSIERRFGLVPKGLFGEVGSFLANCSREFLEGRDVAALGRVLFAMFRLEREKTQRMRLKILGLSPAVFGVAVVMEGLKEDEKFGERHIIKGIQSLVPGIKPVPQSYFSRRQGGADFYYVEIKKMRGGVFSKGEKERLSGELGAELLRGIERGWRSLFLPGKEEELFKNISHLSKEIKYVNDLPQGMISFVEYFQDTLKFLVIVLRLIKPGTKDLQSAHLPSIVHFSLENILLIEKLKKKYQKEASIFTLEVKSSQFLQSNNTINLRAARQYVAKVLEGMIGPFRDYNGGLLIQENEQLARIKGAFAKQGVFSPFFDDLFYAIKPIPMRSLITIETAIQLALLHRKISAYPLDSRSICEFLSTESTNLAIVKTKEKDWKAFLPEKILSKSSQIGCSCFEIEGDLYLCFFHQAPKSSFLREAIEKELSQPRSLISDQKKAILKINFQGGDPPSLNPRLAADMQCHILSNFLFEGLTRINRFGEIELAAAEKLDISPSKTRYTFTLRPSHWSNGEEVTAYHFERTLKKALMANPAGGMCLDFFSQIRNAKKARENAVSLDQVGISAKNGKKLVLELQSPCPYFLNLLASPPFFPLFGDGEEPRVYNGPFVLSEWVKDEKLELSQNPFYWDSGKIKLGGISISMIPDPRIAYDLFKRGELDLIGDPISPLPPEMLKFPEVKDHLLYRQISRVFWIHCNFKVFPLNNEHVRRALSLAIDRKRLTEKVFISQIPHTSPLPPKYASFQGSISGEPEMAKFLFQKGLDELGLDRESFPKLAITHSDLSFEKKLMEELIAQWKETLGIAVSARQLKWSEFSSSLEKGDFQLGGLFRRDILNNPMSYLSFFKKSPNNFHSWDDKDYERLLRDLYREKNKEENLKRIERLLIEKAPMIPLINQNYLILKSRNLRGLYWNENGCLDLRETEWDETEKMGSNRSFCLPVASGFLP